MVLQAPSETLRPARTSQAFLSLLFVRSTGACLFYTSTVERSLPLDTRRPAHTGLLLYIVSNGEASLALPKLIPAVLASRQPNQMMIGEASRNSRSRMRDPTFTADHVYDVAGRLIRDEVMHWRCAPHKPAGGTAELYGFVIITADSAVWWMSKTWPLVLAPDLASE